MSRIMGYLNDGDTSSIAGNLVIVETCEIWSYHNDQMFDHVGSQLNYSVCFCDFAMN